MKIAWMLGALVVLSARAEVPILEDETPSGLWQARVQQARLITQSEARTLGAYGAGSRQRVACVSELVLRNRGRQLPLLAKFYSDLCDVNRMWLVEGKSTLTVVLEGSDASEGYRAEFAFTDGRLVSRTITSLGEVVERTVRSYPVLR